MVDAAGAIYVIGGSNGTGDGTFYADVWASTDGGARPDCGGWSEGGTRWVLAGTGFRATWVYQG